MLDEKGATMTNETKKPQLQEQNEQDWYEVEVENQFHPSWFSLLDGWEIRQLNNGNTLLSGPVIDQPALHGLLARIRDMNLRIISLRRSNQLTSEEISEV